MLSERIFPTFPSEILPENSSTLAYGPYGTVAIASGSLINFAFISNQDKNSNNINIKEIKPMFSISVGLNPVTALKFDTNKQFSADPILYIGDSAGNIFIYNYQKHEYLAVYSPNGHWKDDRYVHVQQIEIDFLPDSDSLHNSPFENEKNDDEKVQTQKKNNKSSKIYKNKNIIVLFKSKKIVSYSIIQEDETTEIMPKHEVHNINHTDQNNYSEEIPINIEDDNIDNSNSPNNDVRNNNNYNNSFYKSNVSNSIDSIASALNFSVNWVVDLESEMTNFSIDPFTNKRIFLYNKNKDNSFIILNLEEHNSSFSSVSSLKGNSGNMIVPKVALSSSLNKYDFKSHNTNGNSLFITPLDDTEIIVHQYSTIQCAQFSRHIQNHVYILTEHVLILYNIDLDLFTRVNLTNIKSQKSAHFDRIIQFETDHRKLLLVYKTGAITLFSLNSLSSSNQSGNEGSIPLLHQRKRSASDFFTTETKSKTIRLSDPGDLNAAAIAAEKSKKGSQRHISFADDVQASTKVRASDDQHIRFVKDLNEAVNDSKSNFSFKATLELKHIVQSQQFITCASPSFEADRDDIVIFLYHPFGIALFDLSRMRFVSCCPLFSDKTTCYSTNEKYVAYGSSQGNIRIRSIFDNSFFFSLHVLDDPIQFINISKKSHHDHWNTNNELNNIHIFFGSSKKIGEFCVTTRRLTFFPSPSSFSVQRAIGSRSGGLIVQRDDETAGVFVKKQEVFLSLPENDKIIDICFNENEYENEEGTNDDKNLVGQDERGSFMILRKNNIVEMYKYNKFTKYSFTDNNYNCSSSNFLNDNSITTNSTTGNSSVSAAAMKRRIIAHINTGTSNISSAIGSSKGKEKEKETKFAESTCISLSGVDFALGFNDGSVFLLKTNDQTFAKRVEVLSSVPIVQMKYCKMRDNNMKINKVLFCLTKDKILCEVNLFSNEVTSKVTLSHVESFSIINSSFIMVKNETNDVNKIGNMNNNNNSNNNAISSSQSNANITSVSSKTNISSISSKSNLIGLNNNNNEDEAKANIYTPYDDDLIYPFPVISKYKKVSIVHTPSILHEESSSSIEDIEKDKETEIEEDSSYSSLEKKLSFPILKEILKEFIINNPLPQILKEFKSWDLDVESLEKQWFLFLPSIYDDSNNQIFHNYLLRKNEESDQQFNSSVYLFGSPSFLPYTTDVGRDFWMLLLRRSAMRQSCRYASGEDALEYEVALSRILECVASISSPTNLHSSTSSSVKRSLSHYAIPSLPSSNSSNQQANKSSAPGQSGLSSSPSTVSPTTASPSSNKSLSKRENKFRMELFYALVYAHRYDEATNALTYNPDSDTFMSNTILAAALLGFSEFDISSSNSKDESSNQDSSNSNSNSNPISNPNSNSSLNLNSNSIPSLKNMKDDSSYSLSMSAREQQYAVIKHAATQMIMLSTVTGRLVDGANLLRLSQLDSFAASILIQAGQIELAMKFIRGMKTRPRRKLSITQSNKNLNEQSQENNNNTNDAVNDSNDEKAGFCYEIGAKCYKNKDYKNAIFFFLTANEHFLALLSFFMFATSNFPSIFSASLNAFNIHFAQVICDIYFLKMYLVDVGLFTEPLMNEKDEVLRKKKLDKLGSSSPLLDIAELSAKIDMEFKIQIKHLEIDEELFFPNLTI